MPRIPEETIVAIREATDIVALVGEYVRDLKASGRYYKALSPFNSEKTPSFFVSPERQTYNCYSSGEHGNCFTFLMKMENISFPEAVAQLGARAGIEVTTVTGDSGPGPSRDPLYRLNAWARDWFAARLRGPEGAAARGYLEDRRISEQSQLDFSLGWAPDSWDGLLSDALKAGFSREDLETVGLVVVKSESDRCYDRFRGRVMFPILDARERVVGFGGRVLEGDAVKYVNSPESLVFHKSRHLYGLHRSARGLRRDRTALLCEGYTDVIMAHQYGFDSAVAALGTALNEDHARLLKRWVDRVLLVLDGDEAGKRAAWRALPHFYAADLEVRLVVLPEGCDPCDLLTREGEAAFRERVDAAGDPIDVAFGALGSQPSPDDVARIVSSLTPLIHRIPSEIRRTLTLRRLADLSGLSEGLLEESEDRRPAPRPVPRPVAAELAADDAGEAPSPAERAVLGALIARPDLCPVALDELTRVPVKHVRIRSMVTQLITYADAHPGISGDHAEALFQDPGELELAQSCRQGAPAAEAERLLFDGLRRLKENRIRELEALARRARADGDTESCRAYERTRYDLTRDLKGPRPDSEPTARNA